MQEQGFHRIFLKIKAASAAIYSKTRFQPLSFNNGTSIGGVFATKPSVQGEQRDWSTQTRAGNYSLRIGRGDKIRTCDPLHPMQVRYQAAPRPDRKRIIAHMGSKDFESRGWATAA
jgi:hypothetical protein